MLFPPRSGTPWDCSTKPYVNCVPVTFGELNANFSSSTVADPEGVAPLASTMYPAEFAREPVLKAAVVEIALPEVIGVLVPSVSIDIRKN